MLSQRFLKIWFAGELDEEAVEHLRRKMAEALARHEWRMLFRFYLNEGSHEPYYDALRRILLNNISLSIIIEEKPASELRNDLEKASGEKILLILGRGAPRFSLNSNLMVEEVGEGG